MATRQDQMVHSGVNKMSNEIKYVIDVCEFKASEKKNKVKRALTRIPSTDSNRMRKEERFIKGHESLMGNFLYPCNIDLIAKREG